MIVQIIKAFTKDKNAGNPAGVVFDADHLSSKQMLQIANQLGFSESAFVQHSNEADFKIRFFSPIQEVDMCGHATLAVVHALTQIGTAEIKNEFTLGTNIGIIHIHRQQDGCIMISQGKAKFFNPLKDNHEIASLLGLSQEDLLPHPLQVVSIGTPKLIIPVRSLQILQRIVPDLEGIKRYCKRSDARGFYPFTFETFSSQADFHARQFNPLAGIDEDPITGIAAGALGAYIKKHGIKDKDDFIVEQGHSMKKPGEVFVHIDEKIQIGGYTVMFDKVEIEL